MIFFWLIVVFLLGGPSAPLVHSTFVTPILPLSFFFSYDNSTLPFPVPVTEQCEIIHITWQRGTALGPNPTAPYFLQVYTSNFIQPFIIPAGSELSFDWPVPFAPGTLYQICMFDKFGNTGGCQATYTVVVPSAPSTCANVTFVSQLGVSAVVDNGPMSQYGFIDQCTDISLTPMNGTPPYTLTVAPALHPPYNITSFDMNAINWTVSLNWAMPFFISLADSSGSLWSNGPLHAGSGGTISCLAGNVTVSHSVKVSVAVGISFLTLLIGAFLGGVGLFMLSKRRSHTFVELRDPKPTSFWGRIATTGQPAQSGLNPFQISSAGEQGPAQNQVFDRRRNNRELKALPITVARTGNVDTEAVERPPSYPEYSPAESEYITRELRLGRNISTGTTTTVFGNGSSSNSSSSLDASERHYNPRGPLSRPRRLTDL